HQRLAEGPQHPSKAAKRGNHRRIAIFSVAALGRRESSSRYRTVAQQNAAPHHQHRCLFPVRLGDSIWGQSNHKPPAHLRLGGTTACYPLTGGESLRVSRACLV